MQLQESAGSHAYVACITRAIDSIASPPAASRE
jgi:hypothetical protein